MPHPLYDPTLSHASGRCRLDEHVTERRMSSRIVIEYGSSLAGSADPKSPRKSKATIYLAVITEPGTRGLVHRGEESCAPATLGEGMCARLEPAT
jgi:hypothetical protein